MKAVGLVEELSWTPKSPVPAHVRARLAVKLGEGQQLSEIILENREEHV